MAENPRILNLAAILVAAGPSSRLGQAKQLVKYEGETLVRRSAGLLLELDLNPVVVTGFGAEKVAAEMKGLPVKTVVNPEWEKGMGGSIAYGARFVPPLRDGILVMVCDQWLLRQDDLEKLVAAWASEPSQVHVASWQEGTAYVSGPPAIFPGKLHGELKGLEKSRGARQIIDRYIDIVKFIELQSAARDLDRPEDLQDLLS